MTLNDLPQSDGWSITAALIAAIAADEVLGALPLVRNPRRPEHLNTGNLVIILAEKADELTGDPGSAEIRQRTLSIGVLSRELEADARADAVYRHLHVVAYKALRVLQATKSVVRKIKETGVQFTVDDIDVDGAIVVGGWAIDYRHQRPD